MPQTTELPRDIIRPEVQEEPSFLDKASHLYLRSQKYLLLISVLAGIGASYLEGVRTSAQAASPETTAPTGEHFDMPAPEASLSKLFEKNPDIHPITQVTGAELYDVAFVGQGDFIVPNPDARVIWPPDVRKAVVATATSTPTPEPTRAPEVINGLSPYFYSKSELQLKYPNIKILNDLPTGVWHDQVVRNSREMVVNCEPYNIISKLKLGWQIDPKTKDWKLGKDGKRIPTGIYITRLRLNLGVYGFCQADTSTEAQLLANVKSYYPDATGAVQQQKLEEMKALSLGFTDLLMRNIKNGENYMDMYDDFQLGHVIYRERVKGKDVLRHALEWCRMNNTYPDPNKTFAGYTKINVPQWIDN